MSDVAGKDVDRNDAQQFGGALVGVLNQSVLHDAHEGAAVGGDVLGKKRPMTKFILLILTVLIATASQAKSREWQTETMVVTSENDVSCPLWGEKDSLHYTIETSAMIYFVVEDN
jgi:hypothetical protein